MNRRRPITFRITLFVLFALSNIINVFAEIKTVNVMHNTGFRACDGHFELMIEPDAGYELAGPFAIDVTFIGLGDFDEPPSSFDGGIKSYDGLCPGTYEILVTNAYGCTTTLTQEILSCDQIFPSITIASIMHNRQPDLMDGALSMHIDNPTDYVFNWSNGATGAAVENLASGTYTVTVSNEECTVTKDVEIMDCFIKEFVDTGDEGEFTYVPNPEIPKFEIKVIGGLNLDGSQFIEQQVLIKEEGDENFRDYVSSNYIIDWNNGGGNQTTYRIEPSAVSSDGIINVVVSNGCQEEAGEICVINCEGNLTSEQSTCAFIHNVIRPCTGLADGQIDLKIPVPEGISLSVKVDGLEPFGISAEKGYAEIEILNLEAGRHDIEILLGDCDFSFLHVLVGRPTDKEFEVLEEKGNDFECVFLESCDGIDFGEFRVAGEIDFENVPPTNIWGKCEAPILCNGEQVGSKKFSKIKVKGHMYETLLNEALAAGIVPNPTRVLGDSDFLKLQYCENTAYCPVTFQLIDWTHPIEDSQNPTVIRDGDCFTVECEKFLRRDFSYCTSDLTDDFPGGPLPDDVMNCGIASHSLYELYLALDYLNGIEAFIQNPELKELIEDRGTDPQAKCSRIIFCWSDFSIKYNDIDNVTCETVIQRAYVDDMLTNVDSYPTCTWNNEGTAIVCCKNNVCRTGNLYNRVVKNIDPSRGTLVSNIPSESSFDSYQSEIQDKYILDTFYNEVLTNFGKIIINDNTQTIPSGIQKFKNGYVRYDYTHFSNQVEKIDGHNMLLFEHNAESLKTVYVAEKEEQVNSIIYNNDNAQDWIKDFSSNNFIRSKALYHFNEEVIVSGVVQDSLTYDNIFFEKTSSIAGFFLKVDVFGNHLNTTTIENLDTNLIFSDNQNGEVLFASRYQGDTLLINGVAQQLPIANGIVVGGINANNEVEIKQVINAAEWVELLGIEYSKTGDQFTLAFDNVELRGPTIRALSQTGFLTLKNEIGREPILLDETLVYKSKSVKYYHTLTSKNMNTDKLDLVYGENNELFIGLTFSNDLAEYNDHLFDEAIPSQGTEDIALVKIANDGTIAWHRTYGTADEENISQLMYDNNVLFFGGEFNGETLIRELGNYRFINLTSSLQRAYISYIFDEVPTTSVASKILPEIPAQKVVKSDDKIKIYPNPFTHIFNINFAAAKAGITEVTVTDLMGKSLHVSRHDTQVGDNELAIQSLKQASGGVYYIHVRQMAEDKESVHKIIHIR